MAEKKHGLGTVLLVGAAAAAVAGGVVSYIKRAEIQRLAEDIINRVRPADVEDYPDTDALCGADCAGPEAGAAEMNIVDSGLSLEAVGNPEDAKAEAEMEAEAEAEAEAGTEAAGEPEPAQETESASASEAEPDAEPASEAAEAEAGPETEPGPAEAADEGQPKKKTWFWSK